MKRKLVVQGKSTYTISLPAEWIKANHLKQGDDIELDEIENNVVVSTQKVKQRKEIDTNTQAIPDLINIQLWNLYRRGYDKITLHYKNKDQLNAVKYVVNHHILGFEVVEEEKNKVVIESLTEPKDEKHDILLRRMFLLVKESLEEFESDLKEGKPKHAKKNKERSEKVLQYETFCRRNIYQKRISEEKFGYYWNLYGYLSMIQGRILKAYLRVKDFKVDKDTITLIKKTKESFERIYKAFYAKDMDAINQHQVDMKKMAQKDLYSSVRNSQGEQAMTVYFTGGMLRMMYLLTGTMIGVME